MRKLFENLRLLIIQSEDLDSQELENIRKSLDSNDVFYEVISSMNHIEKLDFCSKEFSHIVANNVHFPDYVFTQENYVPVVTTEYLDVILKTGKQPAVRAFSPDPSHVLKKVNLCVGDLPVADKEAIFAGVRALGGTYNLTLNKFITHIISNNPDEDCCYAVKSIEGCTIKIVKPQWIDDCLKLRKFIVEDPYLLFPEDSDLTKLETPEYDVIKKQLDTIEPRDDILKNKIFYIGTDYEMNDRAKRSITSLIENSGGLITKELTTANCYIGKFREGNNYINASKSGISVGNLQWIYWMVEHQKWTSPSKRLLHYPFVRDGLPDMKDFVITSTNFSGDARFYIKELTEALGAEFTNSLTHRNTHLIAANTSGKKYTYALKWSLKVVNHLWLEESYSKWKLQPEVHPKYSHYPAKSVMNMLVGQTTLDHDILSTFFGSFRLDRSTNIIEGSEDETTSPLKARTKLTDPGKHTNKNENKNENKDLPPSSPISQIDKYPKPLVVEKRTSDSGINSTPVTLNPKALADISTNSVRPSSGRKAKDKAAAKLHSDMEDLNLFQKQHKSKDVPLLPDEVEARKRKRDEELAQKEQRSTSSNTASQTDNNSKKKKKSTTHYKIFAIVTGWENNLSRTDTQILKNLGVQLFKDFNPDVNAIISPKLMRTEKFLTGLSYRLEYVISPIFINDLLEQFKSNPNDSSILPKIEEYSLDKLNSKSISELTTLSINELLTNCRQRIDSNDKVFQNLTFTISSKLPGGTAIITKILMAHGANEVNIIKSTKDLKNEKSIKSGSDGSRILITSEKDKGLTEKAEKILEKVPKSRIVEWDWVVTSIFLMDSNHGSKVVFER